jgi:Icc-related predicted phosphoesterase
VRVLALADQAPRVPVDRLAADNEVELVLSAGDLERSWVDGLAAIEVPKLGVHGNHDRGPLGDLGIEDLHLRAVEIGGLRFAGFEGCVRYRPGPHQYTQEEAERLVERLPSADVLVCHAPPFGVNDDPGDRAHVGFRALRTWVEDVRPRVLLHGHTHPRPGHVVRHLGPTRVVHVLGARVVELS